MHHRLFGQLWTWAGRLRRHENNIGIEPTLIVDRWEQLLRNTDYWLNNATLDPDEACVRYYFEQREIQPFHDGNSRHARLMANALARAAGLSEHGRSRYRFGQGGDPELVQVEHRDAVAAARAGDLRPLVSLALR